MLTISSPIIVSVPSDANEKDVWREHIIDTYEFTERLIRPGENLTGENDTYTLGETSESVSKNFSDSLEKTHCSALFESEYYENESNVDMILEENHTWRAELSGEKEGHGIEHGTSLMDAHLIDDDISVYDDEYDFVYDEAFDVVEDNEILQSYRQFNRHNLILDSICPELAPHIVVTPPTESSWDAWWMAEDSRIPAPNASALMVPQPAQHSLWSLAFHPSRPNNELVSQQQKNDEIECSKPRKVFKHRKLQKTASRSSSEPLIFQAIATSLHKFQLKLCADETARIARSHSYEKAANLPDSFTWTDPALPILHAAKFQLGTLILDSSNAFCVPHIIISEPPPLDHNPWVCWGNRAGMAWEANGDVDGGQHCSDEVLCVCSCRSGVCEYEMRRYPEADVSGGYADEEEDDDDMEAYSRPDTPLPTPTLADELRGLFADAEYFPEIGAAVESGERLYDGDWCVGQLEPDMEDDSAPESELSSLDHDDELLNPYHIEEDDDELPSLNDPFYQQVISGVSDAL